MTPSEFKKKTVEDFARLLDEYPIIAAVNMENLPAKQLQQMVSSLRDTIVIKMTKRRLLKLAIEKSSKKDIKEIEKYLEGMPALIFSKENPFKLYKLLEKSKSTAAAKPGQKAPNDLIVPAGPTGFAPGPIIGELGQAGIKAGIENGKVVIKEDSLVAKEGEVITEDQAKVLTRLGIEPMEIGLNIVAVYEDGSIFKKEVLAIDESKYLADIQNAAKAVFNLALEIGYVTKDNIQFLLSKAFNDSKNLAISQDLITDLTTKNLISKAESQMKSLANKLNLPEEKKMEEPKEKKKEEVKEETIEAKEEKSQEERVEEEQKQPEQEKTKEEKTEEKKEEKTEETEVPKEEPAKEKEEKKEKTTEKESEKTEEVKEEKAEEQEEKKLEEIKEEKIESKQEVTEEDMKQAEENLKNIQEKIQKQK